MDFHAGSILAEEAWARSTGSPISRPWKESQASGSQRGRESQTGRERQRQERETDRQTNREADTQRETDTERETDTQIDRDTERNRDSPQGRQGEEGCALCAKCSRLGGKNRALGQGAGRDPPKQGRELSVGQETGLALVVPALMSWKRAETAQHEKASKGKALLMPAGQKKTEQGGKRALPLSTS